MKIRPFTRVSVLLFVVLCHSALFAEDIPLSKKGGVYQLPVEVNGVITLHFILDTGASEVNVPADVALTLYRTGTIRDFLPGKTYTLADGSTLKSSRFILQSLKIGDHRITNVPASIGAISSPLLLGQSFLEKLGAWGIDSQRQALVLGSIPTQDKVLLNKKEQDVSTDKTRQSIEKKESRHAATRKIYSSTGTVYYISSGNRAGTVLLKTDSGLLHLAFATDSVIGEGAWKNGAIWHIHYYKDTDRILSL